MTEYFVKIDDGKELRRELLESSKLCIYVLKHEQKTLAIRKQKEQLNAAVREHMKELTMLLGSLEKALPVLTKRELEEMGLTKPKTSAKKKSSKKSSKKAAKKQTNNISSTNVTAHSHAEHKELSKLQRLEESLQLIEERLEKL